MSINTIQKSPRKIRVNIPSDGNYGYIGFYCCKPVGYDLKPIQKSFYIRQFNMELYPNYVDYYIIRDRKHVLPSQIKVIGYENVKAEECYCIMCESQLITIPELQTIDSLNALGGRFAVLNYLESLGFEKI